MDTPPDSASRLKPFVELLARFNVEFIVIGGQAESLMGSPRATYDTDICYRRSGENLERLSGALRELRPTLRGAPQDLKFSLDARAIALGSNFTFDTTHGPLDLLAWVEPIGDYEKVAISAEVHPFAWGTVRTIALDDLIRVKRHLRRKKDDSSLIQLLAIKKAREDKQTR